MKQNFSSNKLAQVENSTLKQKSQYKYDVYFEQNSYLEEIIYTSQISLDEKYLIVGNYNSQIEVYDLASKQLIKCIKLDGCIPNICIFTNDSNHLICGDSGGKILCYDIVNDFEKMYKYQIHSDWIMDIISTDNDSILTCSQDKSIIITNIKLRKQFLIIKDAHSHQINSIEYDIYNDAIVSCSDDKSIKFFNQTSGQLIFQKQMAHIGQVQLIQLIINQNNLLSSSYDDLKLWIIDYDQKQLNMREEIRLNIINFTFIDNINRIILICRGEVQILDKNLSSLQQIKYQQLRDCNFFLSQYIYIRYFFQNKTIKFHELYSCPWSRFWYINQYDKLAELKVLKMKTLK